MELMHRIREMDKDDLNECKFIKQLREGDEEVMCSSFERLLNKEKAEGREQGRAEGEAEAMT